MNTNLPYKKLTCDLCVIGAGLSGSFAALAAARHGAKVILVQDRPMPGGNASSEIRMWVRGAKGPYARESGLISEMEERNIHYNPTLVPSLSDANLYGMLAENENITALYNASCMDAKTDGSRITSVFVWQTTTYTQYEIEATLFADCSGDSILAPLTGAKYRHGRESKEEFGETLAQETEDNYTMGMSILLAARETDHPVKFTPPPFASYYPTDESFASTNAIEHKNLHGRSHKIATSGDNLWWVELGGAMHSIHDADRVREQLLANIYGVWDHIKNHGDHGMENWDLEWVGFLPGKRESRRYVGDIIVTEKDIYSGGHFEDEIAYGGWPLDDHNPYGMDKQPGADHASRIIHLDEDYGLPYRALYSVNVENLMFAGRNISVSHVALSSTRVMATCALLGQAMGTAAALAIANNCLPRDVYPTHISTLQQTLLDDGVFLLHVPRNISELAKNATINLSAEDRTSLLNGIDRPRTKDGENGIVMQIGDKLSFEFPKEERIETLRIQCDPDYSRKSVSVNKKMQWFAAKLHTGKDFEPVKTPATIVKDFKIYADGKEICAVKDNFYSLIKVPLNITAKKIDIEWLSTNGAEDVRLFSVDFM